MPANFMSEQKRRRCARCHKLTEHWQKVNGSPYHCYDGCYSTTGIDYRTTNGKPLWEGNPVRNGVVTGAAGLAIGL